MPVRRIQGVGGSEESRKAALPACPWRSIIATRLFHEANRSCQYLKCFHYLALTTVVRQPTWLKRSPLIPKQEPGANATSPLAQGRLILGDTTHRHQSASRRPIR